MYCISLMILHYSRLVFACVATFVHSGTSKFIYLFWILNSHNIFIFNIICFYFSHENVKMRQTNQISEQINSNKYIFK